MIAVFGDIMDEEKKENDKEEEKIKQIIELMNVLLEDISVPRNIRQAISDAKEKLNESGDPIVRAGSAVYHLTEASEDINLPPHARTQIWHILSSLETIREE